ncbi:MAG: hypothetical protein IJS81_06680 [Selenomonadaceae bacterium]|nr:hypothetical protein [Selenomonadaceae bacterium]
MLKELITNTPIEQEFTINEFEDILMNDFISLINEVTSVDVGKGIEQFTTQDMEEIVKVVKIACEKILVSIAASRDTDIFVANSLLSKLFDICRYSSEPITFFKIIHQNFTPAQIVAALEKYTRNLDNSNWLTKFFRANPQLFPKKNKKIRTIALYYWRIYSGGIERVLSIIIPIYLEMGYRVVLFTDEYEPDLEYALPAMGGGSSSALYSLRATNLLTDLSNLKNILKRSPSIYL